MKLLFSLAAILFATPTFAAIINVNDATSLQNALNNASSGDIIVFTSNISANATASGAPNVLINGAGFTLTPATAGLTTLTVTTSKLRIENLTFGGNSTGIGVSLGSGTTGSVFQAVSFINNSAGIYISSADGASHLAVSNSVFDSNSIGISIAFSGTSNDTHIQNSTFDGNGYGVFVNTPSQLNDVQISGTRFTDNNEGLHIFGSSITRWRLSSNAFQGNTVYGASFAPRNLDRLTLVSNTFEQTVESDGLFLLATQNSTFSNIEILDSTFTNNKGDGLKVVNEGSISNFSIRCSELAYNSNDGAEFVGGAINNLLILGNIFSQNDTAGLVNSTNAAINATFNYWGSPSGPTNPANPSGTGDKVQGDVNFTPFLTAPECDPCSA